MERGHHRRHQNACGSHAPMERKGRAENRAAGRWLKPRTDVLGYSQPSLTGLVLALVPTQDCVLGYFQPSLRD